MHSHQRDARIQVDYGLLAVGANAFMARLGHLIQVEFDGIPILGITFLSDCY